MYLAKTDADVYLQHVWQVRTLPPAHTLMWMQLKAVIKKRVLYSMRDRRTLFFQLLFPFLCVLLVMLLQFTNDTTKDVLHFSPDMFHGTTILEMSRCSSVFGLDLNNLRNENHTLYEQSHGFDHVRWHDGNFINGWNFSSYLLDTWYAHDKPRYGSTQCVDPYLQE